MTIRTIRTLTLPLAMLCSSLAPGALAPGESIPRGQTFRLLQSNHDSTDSAKSTEGIHTGGIQLDAGTTETLARSILSHANVPASHIIEWVPMVGGGSADTCFTGDGPTPAPGDRLYLHLCVVKEDGRIVADTYVGRIPTLLIYGQSDPLIEEALAPMRPGSKRLLHVPARPLLRTGFLDPSRGPTPVSQDEWLFVELSLLYRRNPPRPALKPIPESERRSGSTMTQQ